MHRSTILSVLWLVVAVTAIAVGLTSVLFARSAVSSADRPLSMVDVQAAVTDGTARALAADEASRGSTRSAPVNQVSALALAPGIVMTRCSADGAHITAVTPANGWTVVRIARGPAQQARLRMHSDAADVRVQLRCVQGRPMASVTPVPLPPR